MAGKQLGSCLHRWGPAHRWRQRWWRAGPPPGSGWAPGATPDWRAGAGRAEFPHTRTRCSTQGGWWSPSPPVHCGCSGAVGGGGVEKDISLRMVVWSGCAIITNRSFLQTFLYLTSEICAPLTAAPQGSLKNHKLTRARSQTDTAEWHAGFLLDNPQQETESCGAPRRSAALPSSLEGF